MRKEYTIVDEAGLHARPASLLVQEANKFPNDITIEYNGRNLTLKSIMAVMSLGVPQGATIALNVEGDNQATVFAALEKVLVTHQLI
jgi:phosphocarrier protein